MIMWEITPLDLGRLYVTNGGQICLHGAKSREGDAAPGPVISWLLTEIGTGRNILVDAGPCKDCGFATKYHNPLTRTEEQQLPAALARHGLRCEDIDTVILTHLHWDHAYGIFELPNAKVYVQEEEIKYAISPLKTDYKLYETKIAQSMGENPYFLKFYYRMELLKGDVKFADGLDIITLPGHTPGSQGVVVETPKGRYAIAGDCVNSYDAWQKRWPCGMFQDMFANLASIEKLDKLGCEVLASHDYSPFEILGKPHADWVEYRGEYDHL